MSSTTSPATVLVTGGNGFVGAATVLELIKRQYKVKATIRSQAKADAFNAMYPAHSGSIEWVLVSDLANEAAMDAAAKDVDYVIHMASPFTFRFTDNVKEILEPARNVTLVTLKAAAKYRRIKHVVITSSFVAVWDLMKDGGLWPRKTYTAEDWNPATWEQAATAQNPVFVYSASKAIAEQAAYDFVEKEKPGFSITTFCPPMIWGPPLQPEVTISTLNTSLALLWNVVGKRAETIPPTTVPIFVDVRDIAYLQVAALTNPKAKNERYLAISDEWYWEHVVDIVKSEFSQLADRLPIPVRTEGPKHFKFDVSKTEKDFGIEWIPLKKSIVDTVQALLEKEADEKTGKR